MLNLITHCLIMSNLCMCHPICLNQLMDSFLFSWLSMPSCISVFFMSSVLTPCWISSRLIHFHKVFWARLIERRHQGRPRTHWSDYCTFPCLAMQRLGIAQNELENVIGFPFWTLYHGDPIIDKRKTVDRWPWVF